MHPHKAIEAVLKMSDETGTSRLGCTFWMILENKSALSFANAHVRREAVWSTAFKMKNGMQMLNMRMATAPPSERSDCRLSSNGKNLLSFLVKQRNIHVRWTTNPSKARIESKSTMVYSTAIRYANDVKNPMPTALKQARGTATRGLGTSSARCKAASRPE